MSKAVARLADLAAVSDGEFGGEQHILLYLAKPGEPPTATYAISLDDARMLQGALGVLLDTVPGPSVEIVNQSWWNQVN